MAKGDEGMDMQLVWILNTGMELVGLQSKVLGLSWDGWWYQPTTLNILFYLSSKEKLLFSIIFQKIMIFNIRMPDWSKKKNSRIQFETNDSWNILDARLFMWE